MTGPAWLTQWKIAPLWDHLGLEVNLPIMLPRFVPSHLLFAQLNRSVKRAELEFLHWMPFEGPPQKLFSSPVSCRSRASLCTVADTMNVLENWRRDVRIRGTLAVIPKYFVTNPPTKYGFCQTHGNCLESALECSQLARVDLGQMRTTKILAEPFIRDRMNVLITFPESWWVLSNREREGLNKLYQFC